jgi:hypothetical protein
MSNDNIEIVNNKETENKDFGEHEIFNENENETDAIKDENNKIKRGYSIFKNVDKKDKMDHLNVKQGLKDEDEEEPEVLINLSIEQILNLKDYQKFKEYKSMLIDKLD